MNYGEPSDSLRQGLRQQIELIEENYADKLENYGFTVKNKIKNEITLKIKNASITSSLKTILNNFDIEDIFLNEPPIDEIVGRVLMNKKNDI